MLNVNTNFTIRTGSWELCLKNMDEDLYFKDSSGRWRPLSEIVRTKTQETWAVVINEKKLQGSYQMPRGGPIPSSAPIPTPEVASSSGGRSEFGEMMVGLPAKINEMTIYSPGIPGNPLSSPTASQAKWEVNTGILRQDSPALYTIPPLATRDADEKAGLESQYEQIPGYSTATDSHTSLSYQTLLEPAPEAVAPTVYSGGRNDEYLIPESEPASITPERDPRLKSAKTKAVPSMRMREGNPQGGSISRPPPRQRSTDQHGGSVERQAYRGASAFPPRYVPNAHLYAKAAGNRQPLPLPESYPYKEQTGAQTGIKAGLGYYGRNDGRGKHFK